MYAYEECFVAKTKKNAIYTWGVGEVSYCHQSGAHTEGFTPFSSVKVHYVVIMKHHILSSAAMNYVPVCCLLFFEYYNFYILNSSIESQLCALLFLWYRFLSSFVVFVDG